MANSINMRLRQLLKNLEDRKKNFPMNEHGVPSPENFPQLLASFKDILDKNIHLYQVVEQLEKMLPIETPKISQDEFKSFFLCNGQYGDLFDQAIQLHPPSIALIVLNSFFKNQERFEIIDPGALPRYNELDFPIESPKLTHTTIEIGSEKATVPISNSFWVTDKKDNMNYIVQYGPNPGGAVSLHIYGDDEKSQNVVALSQEVKIAILKSPFIRGKVIEVTGGSDYRVVDIGAQPFPIIEERLRIELEKNVINLFDKQEEFKGYDIPLKRSVILSGPPGCGKTMIERWLASRVKGKVTTIWVTAKSIGGSGNVSEVFDIARKLSPSLIIMEDLDLISGTRAARMGDNPLGEMLNQMDGLTSDDSIVVVGSTNSVHSLDEALKDRPGRFDRVYEVGKPDKALAAKIARNYLSSRNVSDDVISSLQLENISNGDFTGAQIVEIVKGGIFEAIHRGCPINDLCIKSSKDGLVEQKKLTHKG